MKIKIPGATVGAKLEVDTSKIVEKVDEMIESEHMTISAELDLKTSSEDKLRWLRQNDRNFFKMNKNLEELLVSFITIEDTLQNGELVSQAEIQLKNYLINRFYKPDVQVKPLKASTIKKKTKEGQPLKPGIATRELLNDIKDSKLNLRVNFNSGNRKKVKTP